jgi:hypothetical protein
VGVTGQEWTVETLAEKARELLAEAERLKVEHEKLRAGRGGGGLSTLGRKRQLLNRELLIVADAYRQLRNALEIAQQLGSSPAPQEGSDLDLLQKLATQWVSKAERNSQQAAGKRESPPWNQRKRR